MTPKEKAIELYNRFFEFSRYVSHEYDEDSHTKECALACIEEIISACEYNFVESYNTDWWNKVKEEIKNI